MIIKGNFTKIFLIKVFFQLFLQKVKANVINCDFPASKTDLLFDNITISEIQAYIFVILGSISLLSTCFTLFSFLKHKEYKKSPGDILTLISLGMFLVILSLFISGIRYFINSGNPCSIKSNYCYVIAIFYVFSHYLFLIYNANLSIFIILKMKYKNNIFLFQ